MIVMKRPSENIAKRTSFLRFASWSFKSMGKGVTMLETDVRDGLCQGAVPRWRTYMITSNKIVIDAIAV